MGRDASKSANNVWRIARLEAAKWNDKLNSRAGAAELLNMSEDAVRDTECNMNKHMPVEKAVLMADLYNAPHLLNYYCMNECPIGCNKPVSCENLEIDRVTVKLLKSLQVGRLEEIKGKLLDIAEDGVITEDEKPELKEVMDYLDHLAVVLSELQTISRKVMGGNGA